jgi:hypothetical protein
MMKPFSFRVISESLFEKNDDIITCTILATIYGVFVAKSGLKSGRKSGHSPDFPPDFGPTFLNPDFRVQTHPILPTPPDFPPDFQQKPP